MNKERYMALADFQELWSNKIKPSIQEDTLWKKAQELSAAEKAQVKTNLGLPQEIYSKTEVNGLVDSPHQNYETVDAFANLPATGSKDTIYRVANYDGSLSQVDDTKYSEYAWGGTQYVFLCVKSQIGEVFDISVYNNNTKYADLTAALGTNGVNIPDALRKGGMSVKYVQSSDSKYVQFRLMAQNFTTDVTQWQGVDDKPTPGSDNIVKSGCVANIINNLEAIVSDKEVNVDLHKGWSIVGNYTLNRDWAMATKVKFPVVPSSKIVWVCGVAPTPNDAVLKFYDSDGNVVSNGYASKAEQRTITVPDNATQANASFVISKEGAGVFDEEGNVIFLAIKDKGLDKKIEEEKTERQNSFTELQNVKEDKIKIDYIPHFVTKNAPNVDVGKAWFFEGYVVSRDWAMASKEKFSVVAGEEITYVCGAAPSANDSCIIFYDSNGTKITYFSSNAEQRTITVPANATQANASFVLTKQGAGVYDKYGNSIFIPIPYGGYQYQIDDINNEIDGLNTEVSNVKEDVYALKGLENSISSEAQNVYIGKSYPFIGNYLIDKTFAMAMIDAVDISSYSKIVWNCGISPETNAIAIKIYDASMNELSFFAANRESRTLTMPDGAKYVKAAFLLTKEGAGIFDEEGNTIFLAQRKDGLQRQINKLHPIEVFTKSKAFSELFNNTAGEVESFLFFSDPHYFKSYNENDISADDVSKLELIRQYFGNTPTDFVLCGGDWLTSHKQSVAIADLGDLDGFMNKMFDFHYYPMYGNHDNNYQGELDETDDTSANDGAISNQTMINLCFRKYQKMYYSFKGNASRFYIFDSGTDKDIYMNSYRWEQIDWFANQLISNDDAHIIVGMHIVCNDGNVFDENTAQLATNVSLISQAFNARTTITLNGITYDFSTKQGKVHCILCGHTHYDANTLLNSIPVCCIDDARDGNFDLMLFDYAAGKLKTIRVGTGSDREINLA